MYFVECIDFWMSCLLRSLVLGVLLSVLLTEVIVWMYWFLVVFLYIGLGLLCFAERMCCMGVSFPKCVAPYKYCFLTISLFFFVFFVDLLFITYIVWRIC